MFRGYSRVSTVEQAADNRTSLQEQERVINGIAMTRGVNAYDIAMYSDPGVSGTIPLAERPGGMQLLDDVVRGDVVCASKLDRMFRDSLDAQGIYKRFMMDGVHLILFDLGAEPITGGGISKCIYTVISAFADMERERIAERMISGKMAKKARGGHVGGPAPYGFTVVGSGRDAKLEPNEIEQEIIKAAVSLHRAHASEIGQYAIVARKLTEAGFVNRNGNPFQIVTVQNLIERGRQQ